MADMEAEGPRLDPSQKIDLLGLVWFYLANGKFRRAVHSGDEARIAALAGQIGVRDREVIIACERMIDAQLNAFKAVASELADSICDPWPCWLFLKADDMRRILELMHEIMTPGAESST
jgi:hypothetical protein